MTNIFEAARATAQSSNKFDRDTAIKMRQKFRFSGSTSLLPVDKSCKQWNSLLKRPFKIVEG